MKRVQKFLTSPTIIHIIFIFYFLAAPNYFFNSIYIFTEDVCEAGTYFSEGAEKK